MSSSSQWRVTSESVYPKGDGGNNPFGNRFYGYRSTNLQLPAGQGATYHGVDVGDCVHIVAVTDDETTFLVEQSRPNAMQVGGLVVPTTFEWPGGFADKKDAEGNVDLAASAAQELRQELGMEAELTYIGQFPPYPSISTEVDNIFLGTSARPVEQIEQKQEATEADMVVISGRFGELYDQMQRGELPVAGPTLAAIFMVAVHL